MSSRHHAPSACARLDSSIAELYFNGTISKEDAIAKAVFPDKLERQLVA